jgi:hypothetical protein
MPFSPPSQFTLNLPKSVDILTKSLVNESLEWDIKDNGNKPPKDRTSKHLSDIVTSMVGLDKKKLMRDLPDKLDGVIKPTQSESVQ